MHTCENTVRKEEEDSRQKSVNQSINHLSSDTSDLVLKRLKGKIEKLCNLTSPIMCTRRW